MARQITWSLHTETGNWNTSFNAGRIGDYLNFLGNYWDIAFTRNNGGRIKFILSRTNRPDWAAWTSGFECRINVNFNFNVGATKEALCAYVACHEFGHMVRPQGVNGNVHSTQLGLMSPNCNMPNGNMYQADYPWFDAYPRRPGSKRPHEEPGRMKAAFVPASVSYSASESAVSFGCKHTAKKRPWWDIRPESWLLP
jgi:hypothetical protein